VLIYGLPFAGWFVGTQILSYADRFILGFLSTAAAVGAYSAIYILTSGLISFLTTPLLTAAHPAIIAAWSGSESRRPAEYILWQYVRLFILIAFPVSAGAVAASQSIARLLIPEAYNPDGWLVSGLVVGLFLNMFGLFAHKGLEMAEKSRRMLGLAGLCALVNVVLCILLIPSLEARGAALATLVAYALYVTLSLWMSRPYLRLNVVWSSIGRIGLASCGVLIIVWTLDSVTGSTSTLVHLTIIGGVSTFTYLVLLLVLKELSIGRLWRDVSRSYSQLRQKLDLQSQ
jgi:O-antigen/teichoic acid export membrane protein